RVPPQDAGDGDHPLHHMRQEFAAIVLSLQREHRLRDFGVIEALKVVEHAAECHVRHRLDVEDEDVHEALMSTATATISPASSVRVTCPSPTPSWRRTRSPRSENTTSGLPHSFCTTPTSRIHTPCANPVPIALTMASFAAKRIAMNRSGRRVLASCAISCGMSRCRVKRSPKRSSDLLMRAASSTSTPMPKIMRATPP